MILRKSENTSIVRYFSSNNTGVSEFYNNLGDVLKRYNFTTDCILNFIETGITTILNAPKALTDKAERLNGKIVSVDTGQLVRFEGVQIEIGNKFSSNFCVSSFTL